MKTFKFALDKTLQNQWAMIEEVSCHLLKLKSEREIIILITVCVIYSFLLYAIEK
jgi:hypothetical protein